MRRKDGFTIPLVVVILVVLLIGAGIAYVVLGTDLLSNPKKQFLKYVSENSKILEDLKQDELLEKYERKLNNTAYTSEGTLSLTDNFQDESINFDDMQKLKNTSIHFTGSTDKVNSYDYKNIKVVYSDTTDMTYEYVNYNDYYGIKSSDIVTKFIAFENNNLPELAKKLGINESTILNSIPAKLELSRYDYTKLFTKEELETIKTNYQSVILEDLTDDMFSKSDNVGDKVYTLKITDTQLLKIISDVLTKMQSDELIMNKVKKTMINDFGLSENDATEYITKVQEYINKSIENLSNNNSSFNGETLINVHVNSRKLVKTEILRDKDKISIIKTELGFSFEYTHEENKGFLINFEKTSSADIIKYLISVSVDGNRVLNFEVNVSGLSTLNKITETFDVSVNNNNYKLGYRYEGNNEFLPSIDKTITSQDMLSINTAPNKEAIETLFTQIVKKYNEVSIRKKAESGLASLENDPIVYYLPGALPYELMNILTKMEYGEYVIPFGCLAGVEFYSMFNTSSEFLENAVDTIDESQVNNQSVEIFNSMWETYAGEGKTSTEVTTLVYAIVASNKSEYSSNSENPRLISVTYSSALGETNTYTNTDDIQKITPSSEHKYNINVIKGDDGIINSIVIIEF